MSKILNLDWYYISLLWIYIQHNGKNERYCKQINEEKINIWTDNSLNIKWWPNEWY